MKDQDRLAFTQLFQEVLHRCFGQRPNPALTESESRHLSVEIETATGLTIGWKSLKNYAASIQTPSNDGTHPSVPTLDTLARYVYGAAPTTEPQRKRNEIHYPYWFRYREQYGRPGINLETAPKKNWPWVFVLAGIAFIALLDGVMRWNFSELQPIDFIEDFHSVSDADLRDRGWLLQARAADFWDKRGAVPQKLTLFTMEGDNWPQTGEKSLIPNLLYREMDGDCFSIEVSFTDFIPRQNWQQAGLLLMEDTTFSGKSIRLSIAYNDFFGGYARPGEIIVQAIVSYGKDHPNLEEIAHQPLFTLDQENGDRIIRENLQYSALRIEKQGRKFRFLYSASPMENFSFKELTTYEFALEPKFVGIFALKGFVDSTAVIPVTVSSFRMAREACE